MSSKLGLKLTRHYSINFDALSRNNRLIKFVIIHYTGMRKQSEAIKRLCSPKSKVSSHYFIKNNGEVLKLVPDLYIAWHAGESIWKKYKSLNKYSIGIEINNPGHANKYNKFYSKQIKSLIKLLRFLIKKYRIKKQNILGHSDISPNRKKDPGEKFPWKILANQNLCHWHKLKESEIKIFRNQRISFFEQKKFMKNLNLIGYSNGPRKKTKVYNVKIIKAFQRKFRQSLINGKIDQESLLISKNLLKS